MPNETTQPNLTPLLALDALEQALRESHDELCLLARHRRIELPQVDKNMIDALAHLATLKQQVAELVAQNTTLIESLEEIVEPVAAMQRRCAVLGDGTVIDGMMAIALANDPNNLKIIAKKALSNVTPPAAEGG